MPRVKSRKLLLVFIAPCIVFILRVSHTNQPLLVDESADNSLTYKILFTISVPLTKLIYAQSSKREISTNLSYSYDWISDRKLRSKNKIKKNRKKNMTKKYEIGPRNSDKFWFMKSGKLRPEPVSGNVTAVLWPNQDKGDRIFQQLMYIPANYKNGWNFSLSSEYNIFSPTLLNEKRPNLKKIIVYFGLRQWPDLTLGRRVFVEDKCPVNTCSIVNTLRYAGTADAVLFKNKFVMPKFKRPKHQVWILYLLESPLNTYSFRHLKNVFNWTATYRRDSDIVAPYGKFVSYNVSSMHRPSKNVTVEVNHNYAAGKTKNVAWFVSNCNAKNKRLQFAYELSHYIDVEIYGTCGVEYCPRQFNDICMERVENIYKFYLAFENSNCKDYITEKFFFNGLGYNVIPIVMGGSRRQDYVDVAPPHSFIHVDDFASPKELADYLHVLDSNDTLYNEYFSWKGSGEFINTYFWCRLCALLHAPHEPKSYPDIHKWWAKPGTCNIKN